MDRKKELKKKLERIRKQKDVKKPDVHSLRDEIDLLERLNRLVGEMEEIAFELEDTSGLVVEEELFENNDVRMFEDMGRTIEDLIIDARTELDSMDL